MRKAHKKGGHGDRFDYFLSDADKQINYWESKIGRANPYNPYGMRVEFDIRVVDDAQMLSIA